MQRRCRGREDPAGPVGSPLYSPPTRVRFPTRDRRRWRANVSESASLLLFGDEQISFPGVPPCAPPQPEYEPPRNLACIPHCPGQLCLGPSQLLLADPEPQPIQPSLLPEPPPARLGARSLGLR